MFAEAADEAQMKRFHIIHINGRLLHRCASSTFACRLTPLSANFALQLIYDSRLCKRYRVPQSDWTRLRGDSAEDDGAGPRGDDDA